MRLADFEERVWEVEGVRIVVRGDEDDEVEDYDYKYAAIENWSIAKLVKMRVRPRIGSAKEVVIRGNGEIPNGNVILRNLRESYSHE